MKICPECVYFPGSKTMSVCDSCAKLLEVKEASPPSNLLRSLRALVFRLVMVVLLVFGVWFDQKWAANIVGFVAIIAGILSFFRYSDDLHISSYRSGPPLPMWMMRLYSIGFVLALAAQGWWSIAAALSFDGLATHYVYTFRPDAKYEKMGVLQDQKQDSDVEARKRA